MDVQSIAIQSEKPFSYWLKKNWYYHTQLTNFYSFVIPKGKRVLHVGSKNGYLLHAVKPSYGVGIDDDKEVVAQARQEHPHIIFFDCSLQNMQVSEPFDYIILSSVTME